MIRRTDNSVDNDIMLFDDRMLDDDIILGDSDDSDSLDDDLHMHGNSYDLYKTYDLETYVDQEANRKYDKCDKEYFKSFQSGYFYELCNIKILSTPYDELSLNFDMNEAYIEQMSCKIYWNVIDIMIDNIVINYARGQSSPSKLTSINPLDLFDFVKSVIQDNMYSDEELFIKIIDEYDFDKIVKSRELINFDYYFYLVFWGVKTAGNDEYRIHLNNWLRKYKPNVIYTKLKGIFDIKLKDRVITQNEPKKKLLHNVHVFLNLINTYAELVKSKHKYI